MTWSPEQHGENVANAFRKQITDNAWKKAQESGMTLDYDTFVVAFEMGYDLANEAARKVHNARWRPAPEDVLTGDFGLFV